MCVRGWVPFQTMHGYSHSLICSLAHRDTIIDDVGIYFITKFLKQQTPSFNWWDSTLCVHASPSSVVSVLSVTEVSAVHYSTLNFWYLPTFATYANRPPKIEIFCTSRGHQSPEQQRWRRPYLQEINHFSHLFSLVTSIVPEIVHDRGHSQQKDHLHKHTSLKLESRGTCTYQQHCPE